jgi:hypothetical protein
MSRLHCSGVLPFVPNQKWGFEVYWIDDKIEVIWLVFLTYFSIFQWQKSINPAGCEYRAWVTSTGKMRSMHILFIRILPIFVFIIGHFQSEFSFATDSVYQICFKAQIACRRGANIPCRYAHPVVPSLYRHHRPVVPSLYRHHRYHRRHPASSGTVCGAVCTQAISLSLTEHSDVSVRILRQHFRELLLRGGVRATSPATPTPTPLPTPPPTPPRQWRRARTRTSTCRSLQCCTARCVNVHPVY